MNNNKLSLLFGIFCLLFDTTHAIELTGLLNSHDPATLTKDGDTYWHFTTGEGIWSSVSTNLIHWEGSDGPVFPIGTWPSWINDYVPDFAGHFWAPDVIFMNNMYYLYYSCSTFGSSRSAIGVVRTASLNDPAWEDLGVVVSSNGTSTAINAIDPGLFRDTDGKIYMTYGSWFGGIGIVEIDSLTGWANTGTTHIYGGSHQSIEASTIIKEGEYYYLIVNRGKCCDGINSTYYITAGRSTNVMGPYEDFRTILSTDGKYIGPGHFGLLKRDGCNFVSIHYYDGNNNGNPKLDILKMTFNDDWPELTRDFTFDPCIVGFDLTTQDFNDQEMTVYPNPTRGIFQIDLVNTGNEQFINLSIFDHQGKKVYIKNYLSTDEIIINANLEIGIYYVHLENGDNVFVNKIMVQ